MPIHTALVLPALALLIALAALLWLPLGPRWRHWRRARQAARPFPADWRRIMRKRVPLTRRLPADLLVQLRHHMQVFLAEKTFVGCQGLVITDEIRVTIAAQACLLLLNHPGGYFPWLREILVYPSAFVVDRVRAGDAGVQQEQRRALAGESWTRGRVVLSWEDVRAGADQADDGRNVVLHEFAHQLDQETGYANGAPDLGARQRYQRWSAAFSTAYGELHRQLAAGEPTVFNPYGAQEPAEFFAVATEAFFEQPHRVAEGAPAVYAELLRYYRVDPRHWHG